MNYKDFSRSKTGVKSQILFCNNFVFASSDVSRSVCGCQNDDGVECVVVHIASTAPRASNHHQKFAKGTILLLQRIAYLLQTSLPNFDIHSNNFGDFDKSKKTRESLFAFSLLIRSKNPFFLTNILVKNSNPKVPYYVMR